MALYRTCLFVLYSLLAITISGQQLPAVQARTLDGEPQTLPESFRGVPSVVLVGFSGSEVAQGLRWRKALSDGDLVPSDHVQQVAVLNSLLPVGNGVRRFLLRRRVAVPLRKRFLTITDSHNLWRRAMAQWNDDDAYVLILDKNAAVFWKTDGPASPDGIRAVAEAYRLAAER